jgi:glycosyltransferase involved in cell wall biosynthesis
MKNKILIVGLFLSEKNKHKIYRTAADQLAELLEKNNYPVIKTSTQVGKAARFTNTLFTILTKANQYSIAIVPLYGGTASLFWAESATWLLKLFGKKTILIIHGGSIPKRMETQANNYLRTIKKADVVVCPSNFIIQSLKKHNVESIMIENVLNLSEYHFHHKQSFRPNLFWMRTFEDVYNPLMAVRVVSILKKKYPQAKLLMAGRDAGMLQQTIQLTQQLNLTESISLPGYIDNKMKNKIAEEYDIHICTNIIDNAPVSMIEMMSLGLPIVSTNAGGIPYLITNNVDGLLVDVNDDNAMTEKISLLIDDKIKAQQLVENGLQTSKKYDEPVVLEKWKEIFEQLNYN